MVEVAPTGPYLHPPPSAWYMFTIAFICCLRISTSPKRDFSALCWVSGTYNQSMQALLR
jgi:hypothetical protein